MIKTNRTKSISEIERASKVVVEHLFNHHEYCDEKGCRPKLNARLKRKEEGSQSHYRCKKKTKNFILKSGRLIDPLQPQLDSKSRFMTSTHRKMKR